MKKLLTIILALMLALACSAAFVSCNDGENDTEGEGGEIPAGDIVVSDFEQWGPDFQLIRLSSHFGRVTRNRDAQYVKSGQYSAKVEALGGYSTGYEPIMTVPLVSANFNFNYSDFRWYDKISCSVYSAQPDNYVKIGLQAGDGINSFGGNKVLERKYMLEEGWNELTYEINASLIALTEDPMFINGITFSFENADSRELEDAKVMYIDDIILTRRAEQAVVEDLVQLKPYEICDFEDAWQSYIISWSGNSLIIPDMEVVGRQENADRIINPTSGNSMLHVHLRAGSAVQGSLNYINVPQRLMQEAFQNITSEEIDRGYLMFDVYNDGAAPTIFYPQFYNSAGALVVAYDFSAATNQWTTFRVKLSDLRDQGILPADKVGTMTIPYWEFVGDDRDFYFDNFRIAV